MSNMSNSERGAGSEEQGVAAVGDDVEFYFLPDNFHHAQIVGGHGQDDYAVLVVVGGLHFGEVGAYLLIYGRGRVGKEDGALHAGAAFAYYWALGSLLCSASVLAESPEMEFCALRAIGKCLADALGGGRDAADAVACQPRDDGECEAHLAHNVDGDVVRLGLLQDFLRDLLGQLFYLLFVSVRVNLRKGHVLYFPIRLRRLPLLLVPFRRWVVGEVEEDLREENPTHIIDKYVYLLR